MFKKDFNRQRKFYKGSYRSNSFQRENVLNRRHVNRYFDKQSSYSWQTKVLYTFLSFVVLYLIYFLFFSSYFIIDSVVVEGSDRIEAPYIKQLAFDTINKKRLLIFKNNNYFLFSSKQIRKELEKNNSLESLDIERKYFSTIFVKIKEKEAKFAYLVNNNFYLVDKEGNIIARVEENNKELKSTGIVIKTISKQGIVNQKEIDDQNARAVKDDLKYKNTSSTIYVYTTSNGTTTEVKEESRVIPQVQDIYSDLPQMGNSIFDKSIAERIAYIDESYKSKIKDSKIENYEYDSLKEGYITMIDRGIKVYFKLDENLEFQISNLSQYFSKNSDIKNLKYIDLRQKDQVIIK